MIFLTVIGVIILSFFWINRANGNMPAWVRYAGWALFIAVIISSAL